MGIKPMIYTHFTTIGFWNGGDILRAIVFLLWLLAQDGKENTYYHTICYQRLSTVVISFSQLLVNVFFL